MHAHTTAHSLSREVDLMHLIHRPRRLRRNESVRGARKGDPPAPAAVYSTPIRSRRQRPQGAH